MSAETTTQDAPYAYPNAVLGLIQRYRDRTLPEPITPDSLRPFGISPGNAPRTLQALRFLGLIDDAGRLTESFVRLRQASTEEYPGTLAEVVRAAYHPVFSAVDPARDDLTAINDAFQRYTPADRREHMVRLFMSLGHEAGIMPEEPSKSLPRKPREQPPQRPSDQETERPDAALHGGAPLQKEGAPLDNQTTERSDAAAVAPPDYQQIERLDAAADGGSHPEKGGTAPDYHLADVLIQQLPEDGKWTKARRDLWMQAMTSAVDLLVEVIPDPE